MEDKIKATLEKVIQLTKQNKEFGDELRKRLGIVSSATSSSVNDTKFNEIEKYLGLDYSVDNKDSIIDYSFITISEVKNLLVSDNREMMRYRYGARYHTINFTEFCRCAHLQSEMLLNYFYYVRNGKNLLKIKEHILSFCPSAWGVKEAEKLSVIPYYAKLSAFANEFQELKIFQVFNNLRTIRNELSHRSTEENDFEMQSYRKKLKSLGLPTLKDGKLDLDAIEQNHELKNLFDSKVKKSWEYKQYCILLWSASTPYGLVIEKLKLLSYTIKLNT